MSIQRRTIVCSSNNVYIIDSLGNSVLTYSGFVGFIFAVAIDTDGSFYVGGASTESPAKSLKKIDSAGNELWYVDFGAVRAIVLDGSGNIYFAADNGLSPTVYKYDKDGNFLWSYNHRATLRALCLGEDGYLYIAGNRATLLTPCHFRKLTTSGSQVSVKDLGSSVTAIFGIGADSSGNVFVTATRTGGKTTYKFNSSYSEVWSFDDGSTRNGLIQKGGVATTVGAVSSSVTTRTYTTAGAEDWTKNHGNAVYAATYDADDNIYTAGGAVFSDLTNIRKYSTSGVEDTAIHYYISGSFSAIAVNDVVIPNPIIPSLFLGVGIGSLFAGGRDFIPSISIPLLVAAPTSTPAPTPPLGDGNVVYRCYLTGASALVELQISAIECRRRRDQSTWLGLTVPATSAAQRAAITEAVGLGQLVVYSGLRASDGSETMGEFLRATLTDYEESLDARSSAMVLTGRVAAVLETLQSRTLEQVYERANDSGRRSIKCRKVNPVLRPGDTVIDGADSFVAHNITYQITPTECWMQVQEAPL